MIDTDIKDLEQAVAGSINRYVDIYWETPVPHVRLKTFFTSRDPETGEMIKNQRSPTNWVYYWWKSNINEYPKFDDFVLDDVVDSETEEKARALSSGQRSVEFTLNRFLDYYESNPDANISLLKYFRDFDPVTNTELKRATGPMNRFQTRYQEEKKKKRKNWLKFDNFILRLAGDAQLKKDIRRITSRTARTDKEKQEQDSRRYSKRVKSRVRRYVIRYYNSGTYVPLTQFFTDMDKGQRYAGNHKGDMNFVYDRWRLGPERDKGTGFIDYVLSLVDEEEQEQKARDIDSGKRNIIWLLERYVRVCENGREFTLTNYFQNFSEGGVFRGNCAGKGNIFYSKWRGSEERKNGISFPEYISGFAERDLAVKALEYDRLYKGKRDKAIRKR